MNIKYHITSHLGICGCFVGGERYQPIKAQKNQVNIILLIQTLSSESICSHSPFPHTPLPQPIIYFSNLPFNNCSPKALTTQDSEKIAAQNFQSSKKARHTLYFLFIMSFIFLLFYNKNKVSGTPANLQPMASKDIKMLQLHFRIKSPTSTIYTYSSAKNTIP